MCRNPPKPTTNVARHHPVHYEVGLQGTHCADGEQESSQPADKQAVDGGKDGAKDVDPQWQGNDDEVEDQEQQIPSHDDEPEVPGQEAAPVPAENRPNRGL